MGIYSDCSKIMNDKPGSTLTALEREVLYARIRAFSVRVQYLVWNMAATVLLYLFDRSLLNEYLYQGWYTRLALFHAVQLISIVSYFATSLSNPGYIECNEQENALFFAPDSEPEQQEEKEIDADDDAHDNNSNNYVKPAWNRNIVIDPNDAPFNFCWRCKFVRPIRSKHCYDCDRCIGKFDHHCPMLGNCIGGSNHRFFLVFLFSQGVVVVWCFQVCMMDMYDKYSHLIFDNNNNTHADADADAIHLNVSLVFRLLFFVAMFFAMFIVIGLCGFHCYLSCTNQTTFEMVKPHILEKWVKEENKRRVHYYATHPHFEQYRAVDAGHANHGIVDEDDDDDDDTDLGDDDHYRNKNENNMISFDEGYLKNMYLFWFAKLKEQWLTPLNCVLKDSDDEE